MTDTDRDDWGRLNAHRALWQEAKTIEAAGELMAQWLLGEIEYQPLYGAPAIDEETTDIAVSLAAINRAGLLTEQSQPGMKDGAWVQREFVTGHCSEEVARLLQLVGTASELVVVTHAPGTVSRAVIPVSVQGNEVNTHLGTFEPFDHEDAAMWEEEANRDLAGELAKCWYVEAFDPVWGRSGRLIDLVAKVLQP